MLDAQGNGMRKKLFICVIFLVCIMREAFATCIGTNSTIYPVKEFYSSGCIVDIPVNHPVLIHDTRQDTCELPVYGQSSVWYCS